MAAMVNNKASGNSSEIHFDGAEYEFRKRLPRKLPKRPNDVYVNNNTNFKAQLVRCERLFSAGHNHLFIHGLGAAAARAINLALQLNKNHHGVLQLSFNTTSQRVVDDLVVRSPTARPLNAVGSSNSCRTAAQAAADANLETDSPVGAARAETESVNRSRTRLVSAIHIHVVKLVCL